MAGGLNLYGFADADPVNFDDPFGLCPPRPLCSNARVRAGVGVGALLNAVGQLADAAKAFVADHREDIAQVVGIVLSRGSSGGGRMRMQPDPRAAGPHTTIRVSPQGKVTNYETWQHQTNPQHPAPWESVGRLDVQGAPHYNKVTKQPVPTPHVHDPKVPGGVRPAHPSEIPRQ